MSETKKFPLRVVLTVTTGRLLTEAKGPRDNGIGDLYDILGWMTNDSPFTHQLGRFAEECKPWLRRWFPALFTVSLAELDAELSRSEEIPAAARDAFRVGVIENWLKPLAKQKYGEFFDVPRIPADDHQSKHAYDELVEMRGTDEGIVLMQSQEPGPEACD